MLKNALSVFMYMNPDESPQLYWFTKKIGFPQKLNNAHNPNLIVQMTWRKNRVGLNKVRTFQHFKILVFDAKKICMERSVKWKTWNKLRIANQILIGLYVHWKNKYSATIFKFKSSITLLFDHLSRGN